MTFFKYLKAFLSLLLLSTTFYNILILYLTCRKLATNMIRDISITYEFFAFVFFSLSDVSHNRKTAKYLWNTNLLYLFRELPGYMGLTQQTECN